MAANQRRGCICSLCVCLEEETLTHAGNVLGTDGETEGNVKDYSIFGPCTWFDGGSVL